MLLATPENMEKCKDIPSVVALDIVTEATASATEGDYFFLEPNQCVTYFRRNMVLAVKICHWVDPISGEPLPAQITAQ
jgi:hypothetical protein